MPNWCETDLIVSGRKDRLDEFFEAVVASKEEDEYSVLRAFLPRPEVLNNTKPDRIPWTDDEIASSVDEATRAQRIEENRVWQETSGVATLQTGFPDWYSWSLSMWGTKWYDRAFEPVRTPRSVKLTLLTAWSTPYNGLERISAQTGLTMVGRWYEGGMGVQGYFKIQDGECLRDISRNYRGWRGG